ncbi:MAG: cytochrome P460 family protein [bacterium]
MKFTNHEGKQASFDQWRGSYVLLSFVYAGCPMPEMCPLTMHINKKIQSTWLKQNKPFPLHFAVATLDPEEDGPEEMKEYATENGLSFEDFTMITGSKNAMADLVSYFNSAPIPGEKLLNHKVVSVLLSPDLETLKTFSGNKYSYGEIKKAVDTHKRKTKTNSLKGLDTTPDGEASRFKNNIPEAGLKTPSIIDLSKQSSQLGIDPKLYDKFWERWPLVNVRFRTSPAEQRFVFANDIAWRELEKGGQNFPDGSVFGKVAFNVGFDPRFPSSYEPTRFSRIQFMKKDSKKYRSTDGWGYALYLPEAPGVKNNFGENEVQACHACHRLASNHDFVFDTPVFSNRVAGQKSSQNFEHNFQKTAVSSLAEELRNILAKQEIGNTKSIFVYKLAGFQGTISESLLPMARLASERSDPFLMLSSNDGFILGYRQKSKSSDCNKGAKLIVRDILPFENSKKDQSVPIKEMTFCDGVFQ